MQSQIRISLRPNNQITITKGGWKKKLLPVYQNYKPDKCPIDFNQKLQEISGLDITQKSQQTKKAPCSRLNKPKSFTRFSGQRIREAGAAMSIACDGKPERCREVTLTLPANTPEAFTALAAYSSTAVNLLFNPIRKYWGSNALWFFVWEYQKRGALHMHIALYNEDEKECEKMAHKLIDQWHKVLLIIGEKANTCMFTDRRKDRCTIRSKHQYHTEPIRKDIGAYFSKYAGKEESKNNWYVQKYPVSRFWGSSRSLKRIVRENSIQFDFDYQGNEKEATKKYTSIIESIIENLSIVKFSSYEFSIGSQSKARMRFCPNHRKILSIERGKIFAEGERSTFYFSQMEFKKAMELIRNECEWF